MTPFHWQAVTLLVADQPGLEGVLLKAFEKARRSAVLRAPVARAEVGQRLSMLQQWVISEIKSAYLVPQEARPRSHYRDRAAAA